MITKANESILASDTCHNEVVSLLNNSTKFEVTETLDMEMNCDGNSLDETRYIPQISAKKVVLLTQQTTELPKPVINNTKYIEDFKLPKMPCCDATPEIGIPAKDVETIDPDETCMPPELLHKSNISPSVCEKMIDSSIPSSPVLTRSSHLRNERKKLMGRCNDTTTDGSPSLLPQFIIKRPNFENGQMKYKTTEVSSIFI